MRVLVAMSGGVDSSLAAVLLKEQGYAVSAVTFKVWSGPALDSLAEADDSGPRHFLDAAQIAQSWGLPHQLLDFTAEFDKEVITPFCQAYCRGRTPNPCILCNQRIKFGLLWQWARQHGFAKIATGHYACIRQLPNGRYCLRRAVDGLKDQSYFLLALSQEQLAHALFPLGELTKQEVRQQAQQRGLGVAHKKESQEICFIPDNDYVRFLQQRRPAELQDQTGDIVDRAGRVLGQHGGVYRYTIGQRRGLGIALGSPRYVVALDAAKKQVVIGTREELRQHVLRVIQPTYGAVTQVLGLYGWGKIRHTHRPALCRVIAEDASGFTVHFDHPQLSITPGQGFALYDHTGHILAGGWIASGG